MGTLDVGSVLADTYEVTRLIGRGGMGEVWLAKHRRLPGKQVAIKVLHLNGKQLSADALSRFRREAEVATRINHPNIVFIVPEPMGAVVKVLDFGISKIVDSTTLQTQEAVLVGTPAYMSPEQALGNNKDVGPQSDVFALGAIAYEMLAGADPRLRLRLRRRVRCGGRAAQSRYRAITDPSHRLAAKSFCAKYIDTTMLSL